MTRTRSPIQRQRQRLFDAVVWTAALGFLAALGVHEAHAGPSRLDPGPAAYRAECGSCHLAYPPALLAPAEWSVLLQRLDHHFGTDASVEPATLASLRRLLAPGAIAPVPAAADSARQLPRISTQRWFVKEHRNAGQGTAGASGAPRFSDCAACHTQAAQADFSESSLRLPR